VSSPAFELQIGGASLDPVNYALVNPDESVGTRAQEVFGTEIGTPIRRREINPRKSRPCSFVQFAV
jgi:hypothetical protein